MAINNKLRHKTQDAVGQAKVTIGKATGNKKLEADGRRARRSAKMKQVKAKIKNLFTR